jgi:hypothetical protein
MIAPHQAAQRVFVRMLHDPDFAAAVLARPEATLEPLGLGARERAWFASIDRRALLHDAARRTRMLDALGEEFKASTALALAETRRLDFLDRFFAAPAFHRAIQERGSLASAYGEFLGGAGLRTPQLAGVVRLEAALARCRRALSAAGGPDWRAPTVPPSGATHVARAPGVEVGMFSPDALAAIQAVEAYTFAIARRPLAALCEDRPELALPAPMGASDVRLGLIPMQTGITLVELAPEVFEALERVGDHVIAVDAIGRALAQSLVEDEVLVSAVP